MNPLTDQVSKALFRKEQRLFSYLHRGIFMGWILGLTGGAGSGKSTAAAILAEMGYPVVDADQVSRALTAAGGEAMRRARPSEDARACLSRQGRPKKA